MASALTIQLEKIENDIIEVLEGNKNANNGQLFPITAESLHKKTKLKNISFYGWSFAIENLEKKGLIESVDTRDIHLGYKLTDTLTREEHQEREKYEDEIESYVGQLAILEQYVNSLVKNKSKKRQPLLKPCVKHTKKAKESIGNDPT